MVNEEVVKASEDDEEKLALKKGAKYLGFFVLLFPQNERKIYYFCSVSFA